MSQRRKAYLYFSTHSDCFIHGFTREWIAWLKPSIDNLHLVRLVFSNGFCLVASFSTRPALPSSNMKRAPSISSEEYIEIDTEYAKCLNIKEGDTVMVECIPDLVVCEKIVAIPLNESDYEILECNRERIEYEMLNQTRVISANFPFPIWINNQPICLKLKSSDPPAKWILISKNTYIDLCITLNNSLPGSSVDTPTSPFPFRTDTSHSDDSNQSYYSSVSTQQPLSSLSSSRNSSFKNLLPPPVIRTHRSSKSDVSGSSQGFMCYNDDLEPETNYLKGEGGGGDDEFEDDNIMSKLFQSIGSLFTTRTKSPDSDNMSNTTLSSDQQNRSSHLLTPQDEVRPPFSHRSLSPSKSFSHSTSHIKQHSWSDRTDFERFKNPYPLLYSLPFRVGLRLQNLTYETCKIWSIDNVFDVFVHPSSLPHHFHLTRAKNASYIVKLMLVNHTPFTKSETNVSVAPSVISSTGGNEAASTTSSNNNGKGLLNRVVSMIADDRATPSPTPSMATSIPPDPAPLSKCTVAVVHMHVVSSVSERRRRSLSSNAIEEVPASRESSISPSHSTSVSSFKEYRSRGRVPVYPGHILMSECLWRQLGAERNSIVLLSEVKEEWRIDCRQNKVSVVLEPVEPVPKDIQLNNSDLIKGFRDLVTASKGNQYGCCFTDHMILPIPIKLRTISEALSDFSLTELVYCRVTCKIERPIIPIKETPLKIYQIFPCDVNGKPESAFRRIDIKPNKTRDTFGTLVSLDNEKKEEEQDIRLEHYGAIKELFTNCCSYLYTSYSASSHTSILITGVGVTSGCGKTSLANLLCKWLSRSLWQFHVIKINCMLLRGKTTEKLQQRLKSTIEEVVHHGPAVILMDDLDELAKHVPQKDIANTKNAQTILDFLIHLRSQPTVVIATSSSRQSLHPLLLQYKGRHIFHMIEIKPPNVDQRLEIIQVLLRNCSMQSVVSQEHMRTVALRTEGFQVKDLVILTERAIGNAEKRAIYNSITRTSEEGKLSSTLGPVWFSQTPPSKKDSTATVVPRITKTSMSQRSSIVTEEDFEFALKNYLPATLKGLSLHSRGKVNFMKVGGLEEAKRTLTETMLWPSKYPKIFKYCPIKQHSGVLLYGAPGTGKTLLAEAVANEFCLNFVSIKGPELINKYIGASEQAVRDLFSRARAAKPCILFFDEFDSLAPQRGNDRTGVTDRVVNQLLTELDGAESSEGVYILAASSRPDLIDPALLRPGRIDKSLYCNIPTDKDERHSILQALAIDLPIEDSADLLSIAQATNNFTGADLKALLYNAQLLAVHKTLNQVKTDNEEIKDNSQTHTDTTSPHTHTTSSSTDQEVYVYQFGNETLSSSTPSLPPSLKVLVNKTTHKAKQKKSRLHDITQSDLERALKDLSPSLPKQKRHKFETIYQKFQSKEPMEGPNQRIMLA